VLIVEDEPRLRQMLERAVREMEFTPRIASSAEEALSLMHQEASDIVILDINLPGMNGIEFFEQVHERWPKTQGIVLTGYGDLEAAQKAIRLDIADFLTKPCTLADLEAALDRAMRRVAQVAPPTAVPPPVFEEPRQAAATASAETTPGNTLQDIERQHILTTLARHGGNREATAAELGISVRTLYYRLAEYQKQGFVE
jgi:DNA-binding NtrC family response regulator